MFEQINHYMRMIKFSHTIFALPFAGIAFVQALPGSGLIQTDGPTGRFYLLLFQVIVAMFTLRSAAMGFNRLVDRKIDKENPRTAKREIPAGVISPARAKFFIALSLLLFFADAFWIGWLPGVLSPFTAFLVLFYSYTKRFTMFAHFFLGLGIGMAPLATWIAMRNEFALLPALWSAGLMFYIAGFDILYSCQDAEYDRSKNLHSIPSRLGVTAALWIARFTHLVSLFIFVIASNLSGGGILLYMTVGIIAILFLTEHLMVRPGKLEHIPIAFFHINASISTVLFTGILIESIRSNAFV